MKRCVACWVGLLLLVSACATTPSAVTEQESTSIKTVAVRSYLGNQVLLQYVGEMVFYNKTTKATVGWNLDDYVTRELTKELSARYRIKPWQAGVAVSPASEHNAVKAIETSGTKYDPAVSIRPAEFARTVIDDLRAKATPGYVDAYIIVTVSGAGDEIANSNQAIGGTGLYSRKLFFLNPKVAAFCVYQVTVVDGRTFATLASVQAGLPNDSFDPINRAIRPYLIPFQAMPSNFFVNDLSRMSDGNKEVFRETILSLIDKSLPLALTRLKMTAPVQTAAHP